MVMIFCNLEIRMCMLVGIYFSVDFISLNMVCDCLVLAKICFMLYFTACSEVSQQWTNMCLCK